MFVAAVLVTACAQSITGNQPNIPATRLDIQSVIDAQARTGGPARHVVNINHVTFDHALVFTQVGKDESTRHEEAWIKGSDGWKPDPTGMAGGGNASPTTN
jgi:hypothetical protein